METTTPLTNKYNQGQISVFDYKSQLKEGEGGSKEEAYAFGLFCHFDSNNDEQLDIFEFKNMLEQIGEFVEPVHSHPLFSRLDTDKDGFLSFKEFNSFLQTPTTKAKDLLDEKANFIRFKLTSADYMKLLTGNNKVLLKPVNRNNALANANIKINIGNVIKRGIRMQVSHTKGTTAVNAIKKDYGVKVTKGFAILAINLSDSVTDDEVKAFLTWLSSIKVDKQIQQTTAIEKKEGDQRVIIVTFICAMTSTVVLSTLFSTLNIKHLAFDFSFDVTSSPPSLSVDASAIVSNGCIGLIKEPDFQPLIPLIKLFENANVDVKFSSLSDFMQSGKFDTVMKLFGFPSYSNEYRLLNQFLTSHGHSEMIRSHLKSFIQTLLTFDDSLTPGGIYIDLVKSFSSLIICNPDNVLNISFQY